MRVTEKTDVYSFGVVTLEVVMGRHPVELVSSLSYSTTDLNVLLKDVMDCRLALPAAQAADMLLLAVRVALKCLSSDPQSRPSMMQVCQELTSRYTPSAPKSFHSTTLSEIMDAEM